MAFEWPIDRSCLEDLPEVSDPPEPGEQEAYDAALARRSAAEDLAVSILWALSGRQFGLMDLEVRPCPTNPLGYYPRGWIGDDFLVYGFVVAWEAPGQWVNYSCGCTGRCEVVGPRVVHLPGPVHSITEVRINGSVLDSSQYTVEGTALYRRDTNWPPQDLGRPAGERGTWSVIYKRGIPAPPGTDYFAGTLAKEILVACDPGAGKCRLPRTVQVTNRQGVTHRVYDPKEVYAQGKTNIPEIDLWLASVNPHALTAPPRIR